MYTYIPIPPPSCTSLPPSLSHPSRWSQSTELISLCYAAASHQLSILHLLCIYVNDTLSLRPSLPFPLSVSSGPLSTSASFFFFYKFIYLIYLFLAELGLRCGARASLVVEHGLQACGLQQLCLMGPAAPRHVGSSGPGLEPMSPASAGGLSTTAPLGKSTSASLFLSCPQFMRTIFFFQIPYICVSIRYLFFSF